MKSRKIDATVVRKLTIGYVRVSTDDQAREGVSLAAQEERIRAFAMATGRTIDAVAIDDGVSAKTLARPELQKLLDAVRKGCVGTVMVLKLDRLTRSVGDLSELLKIFARSNSDLVSVNEALDTSSASGRMVVNMLGTFAQFEREQIAERTAFALAYKRRDGAVYGPIPFGYNREQGRLVLNPNEHEALLAVKRMYGEGVSLRSIAKWLSDGGHHPKNGGKKFYAATIRRMLTSRIAIESELMSR